MPLTIELHDAEEGNTLLGKIHNIDYDYQAEMHVQDCADQETLGTVVRIVVVDDLGDRDEWTREGQGFRLTMKTDRFLGQWQMGALYERKH